MADKIQCGVRDETGRCPNEFEPGHGGRLGGEGEIPKCAMHLQREIRGSPHADRVGKLSDTGKTERLTVWITPELNSQVAKVAAAESKSVSLWVSDWIQTYFNAEKNYARTVERRREHAAKRKAAKS